MGLKERKGEMFGSMDFLLKNLLNLSLFLDSRDTPNFDQVEYIFENLANSNA